MLLRCCHGSVNSVDRICYGVKVEFVVQQWHGLDILNVQHFDKLCVLLRVFLSVSVCRGGARCAGVPSIIGISVVEAA